MPCMVDLIHEMTIRVPHFGHIKSNQIIIRTSHERKRRGSGLLAYVLPMKFRDGCPVDLRRRGQREFHYAMIPVFVGGREILYIISFVLPRFYHLTLRLKLETVIHELYHISPSFNGDVRRLRGRSYLHGNSLKDYDETIRNLTDGFLQSSHRKASYAFLRGSFSSTRKRFSELATVRCPGPRQKLIKIVSLPAISGSTDRFAV